MISDDLLAAYCDGETNPEESAEVEAALDRDPVLVDRLDAMMRVRDAVQEAYRPILEGEVAQGTIDLVRARLADPSPNVVAFRPRAAAPPAARWMWPSAIAAALVAGVIGGVQLGHLGGAAPWAPTADGALGGALAAGLERTASGESRVVEGGVLKVSLSFASADGGACRQFEIAGKKQTVEGLACRKDGSWTLRALTTAPTLASGDFQAAAGPGEDLVSRMADSLIVGAPFDQTEERRRIKAGWVSSEVPAR